MAEELSPPPVPVTEARAVAERVLNATRGTASLTMADVDMLARFVAELPADVDDVRPAADARLAAVEALCDEWESRTSVYWTRRATEVRAALSGAAPAPQPAGEDA